MDIQKAGDKPSKQATADYFIGTVWQEPIVVAPEPARVRALRVAFDPGARTHWHTHPLGQTLYVTHGVGRIQKAGEPVREIKAGDAVWIAPGEKHWHGASPENGMVHIAIQEALDGQHIDWMEPVSDADYMTPPSA